ncbi:uncharacterized protein LOC124662139 [Lolium rigidum]|uniref:uncharacterized protein LOC124662139 n=1 Tax=Lolium rigidum TaxID=89674 RepID=UPI001F5D13BA|nr:uncharacterized protein LOC124662139 [Lolium rigidum]
MAAAVAEHGQANGQTLEHGWAFWLVSPQVEARRQVASERTVYTFSTVDEFWSLYNNILHPSKLGVGADLYCLKDKIEPKLEDPICANGGKWTIRCGKEKSDTLWVHTLLPLIGGRFEYGDDICGAVLSVRGTQDMIAVWTKDSANDPAQKIISNQWKEFMDYKDSIEFIVHDSGATTVQCWSTKLPQDLFGLIYNRLPDPRSRVRFAAVCKSWFATASRHPVPPALPWLLLLPRDGNKMKRLYCHEDNQILRVPALRGFIDHWFIGCHEGGWVATYDPGPFKIVNLFSGFEVALSEKQKWIPRSGRLCKTMIWNIIFSKPPTSSDCILAAITDVSPLALCRIGCRDGGWTIQERRYSVGLADITFWNGELYGLTLEYFDLVKLEIGINKDGAPLVTGVNRPAVTTEHKVPPHDVWYNKVDVSYIFELKGKLGMAVKFPWSPNFRPYFKVFNLVDVDTGEGMAYHTFKWEEVKSLGDFALFLGPNCSRAVHVPEHRHGGVQRNRIYYIHRSCLGRNVVPEDDLVFLAISNNDGDPVYFKEDDHDGVDMIRAVGYYARRGPYPPMWLLPPDF